MNKQITVFVGCVIKGNQILMTQRDEVECPEAHLKWEFPGGKVDFNETPEEAVVREIFEETGVKAKIQQLLPFVATNYWDYPSGRQQTFIFAYLCKFVSEEKRAKDHHIASVEWVDLEKVKERDRLPAVDEIIREVLNVQRIT